LSHLPTRTIAFFDLYELTLQSQLKKKIVLWLLAETDLECNYIYFFQVVLLPSLIGSEIFWQFLSARLTDTSPRHAKTILLVTSVAQIVLDIAAFAFGGVSRWFVYVWFILRFAAQQQVGNSTGKILKMRIEWVLEIPQEKQLNYFNTVVVMGELLGRSSALIFVYVVGVQLGRHGYSFAIIKLVFFLVLGLWDLVCLTCTLLIPMSYFLPENRLRDLQTVHRLPEDDNHMPAIDETESVEVGNTTSDYLVAKEELDKAYEHELNLGDDTESGWYILKSFKRFWANGPLFFSAVHLWTAFMLVSFVNIVLKFHVSEVGTGTTLNRQNLCGGQLVNVLQVGISENTATLFGVLVYNFGMSRVKPYFFYNKIMAGLGLLFCLLFVTIFWKHHLGAFGGSLVLGALYVGLYLVQTFDGNAAAAWSDPTIIAFVFAMQASFAQVLALVPILFAALKFNDTVVLLFCILCSSALGFSSFWYSRRNKQQILLLSDPDIVNHDEISYQPLQTIEEDDGLIDTAISTNMREFLSPEDLAD
jgi:hypothetical protein